jgi:hypothetical protein
MRGRISAANRNKIGATAHHRDRARATARHLVKRRSNATGVIANPIARRSLPRHVSRSVRQ